MGFFTQANPVLKWYFIAGSFLLCLVLLGVLHLMPRQVKRWVTITVTFLAGGVYVLAFLVPPNPATDKNFLSGAVEVLGKFAQVVTGFAILLGIYNLCRLHFQRVSRTREGWLYSVVFFISLIVMLGASYWRDWNTWFAPAYKPPLWIKAPDKQHLDVYTVLFDGMYRNLEATMFSILAFYIVSAAYRAFRIRSFEAAILMFTAVILMLGQVPIGTLLTAWIPPDSTFAGLRIENLSQWVLVSINGPVQRALGFGLSLGQLAMALRIWLSLERGTFFGNEV